MGQIPPNLQLADENGTVRSLESECNKTILVIAGSMALATSNARWEAAANLLRTKYTDGSVKVYALVIGNASGNPPGNLEIVAEVDTWTGFRPNGIAFNDSAREASRFLFPTTIGTTGFEGTMLLRPGYQVEKLDIEHTEFETEIDAVLASL